MRITIEGWDPADRRPVRGELGGVDRGQTQAADLVTVAVTPGPGGGGGGGGGEACVVLRQNPALLQKAARGEVRVGACVWDSGYVLCALLEARAAAGQLALGGARCVELGAGCGLVGLVAARLGASVMLTDKADVLVHSRGNAAKNRMLWVPPAGPGAKAAGGSGGAGLQGGHQQQQQQQAESMPPPGSAGVMALDWSAPDAADAVAAVRAAMGGPLDYVLASDSIYPDPTGCATNAQGFIEACAGLCDSHTRVLITYEWRLPEVREALLGAARARFGAVRVLPPEELPEGWRTQHVETFEMRLDA
ncbi:MAG: hypothetical protein J3K34DRAFT_523316 [Monoraphidium minutum]|nr:MAG: hypothetical protein J3K34DRAFT_523316 [Monoraphidium minutum]